MADNFVQKFTLDDQEILVKDATARSNIATLSTDLGSVANRVTTLEGLSRLTVTYNASTEAITFTTGTHS